jgi:hypothetical protein
MVRLDAEKSFALMYTLALPLVLPTEESRDHSPRRIATSIP